MVAAGGDDRESAPDDSQIRPTGEWLPAGDRNAVARHIRFCQPCPVTTANVFTLPDVQLAKATIYMRALRRGVYSYWYATMEGREAAMIEAAYAAMTVNILDEAIFQVTAGQAYRDHRANDRLGRVVTGLELIRNCETHSPIAFDDLLVMTHIYGVPLTDGTNTYREVYKWAEYADLPAQYVDLAVSASVNQKRARGEAQGAYRAAVQGRVVVETLFDAINFFEQIEPRLVAKDGPIPRWAFAEFTNRDVTTDAPMQMLARPIGLDNHSVFLPDIATRHTERRSAAWGPADAYFKAEVRKRKAGLPASEREILHRVLDDAGKLIGYSGTSSGGANIVNTWIERSLQVWKDANHGHRYFLRVGDTDITLVADPIRNNVMSARDATGADHLITLPAATSPALGESRLAMTEAYPDMYIETRDQ